MDALYLGIVLWSFVLLLLLVSLAYEGCLLAYKGYQQIQQRRQRQDYTTAEVWKALGLRLYR